MNHIHCSYKKKGESDPYLIRYDGKRRRMFNDIYL